jgi:membrane-bound serine protease (ClpP class)
MKNMHPKLLKPAYLTLLFITLFGALPPLSAESNLSAKKVVIFEIREEIAPSATRLVSKALLEARNQKADLVVIDMDTYGGLVTDADSIRYAILRSKIPVVVYINPNAASAGALISIACKRIYMSPGANIGAATVVNQSGEAAPDKFQSYMRSIMRSTAKSHGKDSIQNGDTVWKRNPTIAEAMVDQDIEIEGITEKGKVLTFTPDEAIKYGFCDATAESIDDVLRIEGALEYQRIYVKKNYLDKLIGFLKNPAVSGILVLLIIGGIYYELQSPGIGFPIIVSIIAALLYFAPNYLDGLAANWEIILFFIGLVLLAVEIFVIPGFGVAGIAGVGLILGSLILAMVANDGLDFTLQYPNQLGTAFWTVTIALALFLILLVFSGATLHQSPLVRKFSLKADLGKAQTSLLYTQNEIAIGTEAICFSDLRPFGNIIIEDKTYPAYSVFGFISKGTHVRILRKEGNTLHVESV